MRVTSTPGVTVTMTEPEALDMIQKLYEWIGRPHSNPQAPNRARPVTLCFSMSNQEPNNGWVQVGP